MHKDTVQIVVFKPDPTKTKEYMVILDDVNAYNKWKGTKGEEGDKTVALVEIVDAFKVFACETGSSGTWLKPSAVEIAADFDNFNADGSVKEGVYDHTARPVAASESDEELEAETEAGEKKERQRGSRKAHKIAAEEAIRIILERGTQQSAKNPGTGGSAMNPNKGGGLSTGHIGQGR